jgi:hypothetical protein
MNKIKKSLLAKKHKLEAEQLETELLSCKEQLLAQSKKMAESQHPLSAHLKYLLIFLNHLTWMEESRAALAEKHRRENLSYQYLVQ